MTVSRTPLSLSETIKAFCAELVPGSTPLYLEVTPAAGAKEKDCFPTVEARVKELGGSLQYGWQIWEWPKVLVEAEFHAVWRDASGKLHDITPKPRHIEQILFLPDPSRKYEGRQINNIRKPLSGSPDVAEFIAAQNAVFAFENQGSRASQHELVLDDKSQLEYGDLCRKRKAALARVLQGAGRPGRNSPCYCGSGKKYKKCHASG